MTFLTLKRKLICLNFIGITLSNVLARIMTFQIFGNIYSAGIRTAVMKTFLERICWTLARPGKRPIKGCPEPRSRQAKKAIALVSSGLITPFFRRWCDDATPLIKSVCQCSLNARLVGSVYAGAVEKRAFEHYLDKARKLGWKLTQ